MLPMKKVLFSFVCTVLLVQLSCNDSAIHPDLGTWDNLGLEGKLVNDLKLIDNYLYACAGKNGLYRFDLSQSNLDWTYLGLADTNVERTLESGVTDVISDGSNLLASYAASYALKYSGIYKSVDNGITWFPSDSGMIYNYTSQIIRLKHDPLYLETIFATTEVNLLYKSIDGGNTWNKVYGIEGAAGIHYAISCSRKAPQEVWAGGETGRFAPYLLHSTDEGETWGDYIWFPENFGPYTYDNAVYDIVIDPTNENILYFGMLGVIGKTTDKGETFERILGWEDGIYRHWRISINPNNPLELFATGAYLYRTKDGGKSWQKINPPLNEIYALAVDWQKGILYVSVSSPKNGIYKYSFM